MPRALSEDESDIGDIPFKKTETKQQAMGKGKGGKGKGKGKAEPIEDVSNAVAEDDEDEDMDADEFAVEHIVSHRFEPDGTLKLEVKWVGWPDSANTWEPEENLDGAKDELATYYREIDGKPTFGAVKTRKSVPTASKTTSTKRKAESPPAAVKAESKRGRPAAKKLKTEEATPSGSTAAETLNDVETGKQFKPPQGSWEDHLVSINTIVRDDKGVLMALVQWAKDNKRSQHRVDVLYTRCPQKMLKFYEGCIEFRSDQLYLPYEDRQMTKEEDQSVADAAMAGADKLLESVGEIVKPAEQAVKGVAASTIKGVASMGSAVKGVVARSTPKAPTPRTATPKAATPKSTTPKTAVTTAASTLSSPVKDVVQTTTNGNHAEPAEES